MKIAIFLSIFVALFLSSLSAEDNNTVVREKHYLSEEMLTSFMDILTSEAFIAEFDFEKNRTRENSRNIENLERKIEKVIESFSVAITELSKNRQEQTHRDSEIGKIEEPTKSQNSLKIAQLEQDMAEVKKMLYLIASKIEEKRRESAAPTREIASAKTLNQEMIIGVEGASLRAHPSMTSKVIESLKKDTQVTVEWCDRYDWCKIKNPSGYIAKFILIP